MDEEFKIGFGQALDLLADIAQSLKIISERMPARPGEFSTLWSADEPEPAEPKRRVLSSKSPKSLAVPKRETVYDFLLTIDYLTVTESDSVTTAYARWLAALRLTSRYYPGVTAKVLFSRVGLGKNEIAANKCKAKLRNEIELKAVKYKAVRTGDLALDRTAQTEETNWPYVVHGVSNTVKVSKCFDDMLSRSDPNLKDSFNHLYERVKREAEATTWLVKPVLTVMD